MRLDELCPHIHFLTSGSVTLKDADGHERSVAANARDARFPIARLRPSSYEVTATSASELLCVEQSLLRKFPAKTGTARFQQHTHSIGGSWRGHPLVTDVLSASTAGTLVLPVIPAIALKIRRALDRENHSIGQVSKLIAADPVISAKLLKVANSALYQGALPCQTVQAAVVRLGIGKVQNIVLALSSAALFEQKSSQARARLAAVWRHLIEVAGLSAALAKLNGDVDEGIALLAGLTHEIGKIPILQLAQNYPDLMAQEGLLTDVLNGLGPTVSAATLRQWQLPQEIIEAVEQQDNWSYDHEGACDFSDLLLVAHVLALAKSGDHDQLPRLDETPAFVKITRERLSPKLSLQVLEEVQQRAVELKSLLK